MIYTIHYPDIGIVIDVTVTVILTTPPNTLRLCLELTL